MILETNFYNLVFSKCKEHLEKNKDEILNILKKEFDKPPSRSRILSWGEYYNSSILRKILTIYDVFQKIKMCITLIKEEKDLSKQCYLKLDNISLYLAQIYVLLSTLVDVIFKLVNCVLFTGIKDRDVNQTMILKNIFIEKTKVEIGIKKIQKIMSNIFRRRNEIIHDHCEDYLYDLIDPLILNMVQSMRSKEIRDIFKELKPLTRKALNEQLEDLINKINKLVNDMQKAVEIIFVGLEDIYLRSPFRNCV